MGASIKDFDNEKIANIISVFVAPEARGKGIATKMMAYLLQRIKNNPEIRKITLTVNVDQSSAIKLYEKLLEVHWATHNPTTLNRQGNDVGSQYRSAIFYHNEAQKSAAEKSLAEEQRKYNVPIVTEINPFANFYVAEDYHKNYYDNHKEAAYCDIVISPKIHKLLEKYSENLKSKYKS